MTDSEIDDSWNDESARAEQGSAAQHASLERIEARLANRENYSEFDNIAYLGDCIRKLAMGSIYQIRERIEVYDRVQNVLTSIPGHAEYFGKRIREAYEPLKLPHGSAAISGAQNEMMYSFATLKNLPSPETVKVLGDMLSETWRMKRPTPIPGDYTYTPESLALSAVGSALMNLPLREPPNVPGVMAGEDSEVVLVHPWQNWYSEIKSGRRTFSFKGQSVEYRFRPDGTWDTIAMVNPPGDAPPDPPTEAPRPIKRPLPPAPATPNQPPPPARLIFNSWWIISGGILSLAAVAFILNRRHAS